MSPIPVKFEDNDFFSSSDSSFSPVLYIWSYTLSFHPQALMAATKLQQDLYQDWRTLSCLFVFWSSVLSVISLQILVVSSLKSSKVCSVPIMFCFPYGISGIGEGSMPLLV